MRYLVAIVVLGWGIGGIAVSLRLLDLAPYWPGYAWLYLSCFVAAGGLSLMLKAVRHDAG